MKKTDYKITKRRTWTFSIISRVRRWRRGSFRRINGA